jgi:MFS family permease
LSRGRTSKLRLAVFCLAVLFFWAAQYVYVPVLPVYAESLGASMTVIGLIAGAYGLTQLLLRIPLGMLSDRTGKRKPFIIAGGACTLAASIGLIAARTPLELALWRGMAGVASASWVATVVLFGSHFGDGREAWSMGLVSFLNSLGQISATSVGGTLADRWGLTSPFYAGVALSVVAIVAFLCVYEQPVKNRAAVSARQLLSIGRDTMLLKVSAIGALAQYATFATTYAFVPVYAALIGATGAQLGMLTAAFLGTYTLTSLAAGAIVERWGERRAIVGGMLFFAVGTLVVPLLRDVTHLAVSQALTGVGRGLSFPVLMGLSIKGKPSNLRGSAMGFFQAVYAVGMVIGPSVSGILGDLLGLRSMLVATSLLCILTGLLTQSILPERCEHRELCSRNLGARPEVKSG